MSGLLRFAFALHIHQPVGNFDHVFREHVDEVYRPFLSETRRRGFRPITLHVSGPLLDWLEDHDAALLDEIGREVADGQIELIGSGRYEPILAALPHSDRIEQVQWMRSALTERFGTAPLGLWLTERVWEQDLAADLSAAGVEYTLLDDRHFLAAGLERDALDRPYSTEADGRRLTLLSIDERLRYLIPFAPVEQIVNFLQARFDDSAHALVLGDDGEKFGGWPGTRRWVYERGWLVSFLDAMERLRADGVVELVTTGDVAHQPSGGLAYPSPGSYREMEGWTLPRAANLELERLRGVVDEKHPSIRGGHWRGFQARYPLSNRMHKSALALSRLCRERGDPLGARRAIGRAQCNDAYWHGVFGGVYLPHLRQAVWRELATAEALLRSGEPLTVEIVDHDYDGLDEVRVHGENLSAVISPARGGGIESLLRLESGENDADVLARHHEAYHGDPGLAPPWEEVRELWSARVDDGEASSPTAETDDGTPSIHDLEPRLRPAPLAIDKAPHALFRETASVPVAGYRLVGADIVDGVAIVRLESVDGPIEIRKRFEFRADGEVRVTLDWTAGPEAGDRLETAIVLAHPRSLSATPAPQEEREPIITVARSERGYEEILQGELVRLGWPTAVGRAEIVLEVAPPENDERAEEE